MSAEAVFLNGRFVPVAEAVVSVFDRGFTFGDGLFETLRAFNGRLFRWEQHVRRIEKGAKFLRIALPFSGEVLHGHALELLARNRMPDCLLRINLSRGSGPRGYSPKGADKPTLVMSLHPAPPMQAEAPRWRLIASTVRLPTDEPLARYKTANKLPQILARAEADAAGADDALLLNTHGHIVESSSGNLFWILDGAVHTPALVAGVLPGVTRSLVFEVCKTLGITTRENEITPDALQHTEGVFLSLTSSLITLAVSLDGKSLAQSPIATQIREGCKTVLLRETAP